MAVFILLICFILIFLIIGIQSKWPGRLLEVSVKSALVFSTLIVIITELASAFNLLNFHFILFFWIGISASSLVYILSSKNDLFRLATQSHRTISSKYSELTLWKKFLLFSLAIILTSVFLQGLFYPPNNTDSLTYHLARIINWISHQNVFHYPTHIFRQLYQPPFAEYAIMHINILSSGDYLSFLVQFLFFIFSLVAIISILDLLDLNQYKIIAILLAATIPEVILQASSTQNDLVISFFMLVSVYFAIKAVSTVNIQDYVWLGLSIGLAILTKGTSYIYLLPIVFIFAFTILIKSYTTKNYNYIIFAFVIPLIALSLNSGHFIRNYKLTDNILGIDIVESKMMANEKMSPILLLSNIVKNAGLHIGPYPVNRISDKAIYRLHDIAGVQINNPGTSFNGIAFSGSPDVPNHEDYASNPLHFFLIIISFIAMLLDGLKRKITVNKISLYSSVIVIQMLIFCIYLKWQPWHTRLHTPLFVLCVPLICYAVGLNLKYLKLLYIVLPFFILSSLAIMAFNATRPFLLNNYTSKVGITESRYKKYFASRLHLFEEYNILTESMNQFHYKNVGLMLGGDDLEYTLFSKFYTNKMNPVHINVTNNISKKLNSLTANIDCIISTTSNATFIEYNGKKLLNQNRNNKFIWIYK